MKEDDAPFVHCLYLLISVRGHRVLERRVRAENKGGKNNSTLVYAHLWATK